MRLNKKQVIGFTLMEIMIAVVILGIIAAFAVPSYQRYVIESHEKAVKARLLEIASVMERGKRGQYTATFVNNLNSNTQYSRFPERVPVANARYTIRVQAPSSGGTITNAQTYTITATPTTVGRQDTGNCGTMTYNNFGLKTPVANCWQ